MAVSDYSTTPGSNGTISGINIAENCSPAGINNAIRQMMADIAAHIASGSFTDLTVTGDLDLSGADNVPAIVAALGLDAFFDTTAAMLASTDITVGDKVVVRDGYNGELELFNIVAAATYTANSDTVQALTGITGQAVSARTSWKTVAEVLADTRPYAFFEADAASSVDTRFGAAGYFYDFALSGATDHHLTTAGGVKLYVVQTAQGYAVDAFGASGDGTTDDATALQTALDAARTIGADVYLTTGKVYAIASSINVPTGTQLVGGSGRYRPWTLESNKPGLKALSGIGSNPMLTLAEGDDDNTTRRSHGVRGIEIDGNSQASVGILAQNSVSSEVMGNTFLGFTAGGAAIKAGGALYLYVERNMIVAGDYYSFDAQDSYKGGVAHYYGVNVGTFSFNIAGGHRGLRVEGTIDIVGNDFEHRTESGYSIQITSNESNYVNIRDNYWEVQAPTDYPSAGHTIIDVGTTGQQIVIEANRLYGDNAYSGGIGVDLSGATTATVTVRGNWIGDIETGIDLPSAIGSSKLMIGPNQIRNDVTTHVSGIPTELAVTNTVDSVRPYMDIVDDGARKVIGGHCFGPVFVSSTAEINLEAGNIFACTFGSAATISTVYNKRFGQKFSVYSTNGNLTLANATFNLACGADFTLPANKVLTFEVTRALDIREVGNTSRELWTSTVANLPNAAVLGAGARLFVTDASSPTFGANVAGGGSTGVPVFSDGTSTWKVG